jgi:hypothetical protein
MDQVFPYKHAMLGDIIPIITPVDLQTGANTGQRVNVTGYHRAIIVLHKGIGTAGDDPVFTPLQHDAISGGNSKAISITKVWSKLGASLGALTEWTEVTQAAGDTYTDTTSAEKLGMIALEINLDKLDFENQYKYISLNIPDVGNNAQIGGAFVVLLDKRDQGIATDAVTA